MQFSGKVGEVRRIETRRAVEVSIVMPCLNEADTLGTCIEKVCSPGENFAPCSANVP